MTGPELKRSLRRLAERAGYVRKASSRWARERDRLVQVTWYDSQYVDELKMSVEVFDATGLLAQGDLGAFSPADDQLVSEGLQFGVRAKGATELLLAQMPRLLSSLDEFATIGRLEAEIRAGLDRRCLVSKRARELSGGLH